MDGAAIDPSHLLSRLEDILGSDPNIDEVGFIHPTQFAIFSGEVHGSPSSSSGAGSELEDETKSKPVQASSSDTFFWHGDHKLGISTLVLVPLYRVAKDAFMDAYKRYRLLRDSHENKDGKLDNSESICSTSTLDVVESEVMKHSKALLLLSCDFGTAWNSRKLIVSKKLLYPMFMDELNLSALVLSYSPKSERAWSHRRWVIKMITGKYANVQEIVERDSELVKALAENSKMNYRAWNHRCWLVSYMSRSQVLVELRSSRDWAELHVADNSCFHYRAVINLVVCQRLLIQMIESFQHNNDTDGLSGEEFHQLWKEELDWVQTLIMRYVGREALWLHRRFLSLLWMKHLANDDQSITCPYCSSTCSTISIFIADELMLFRSCTIFPDDDFGDYQAQVTYSATYILWLAKQMPTTFGVELQKSSLYEVLRQVLNDVGKSYLWESLTASCTSR